MSIPATWSSDTTRRSPLGAAQRGPRALRAVLLTAWLVLPSAACGGRTGAAAGAADPAVVVGESADASTDARPDADPVEPLAEPSPASEDGGVPSPTPEAPLAGGATYYAVLEVRGARRCLAFQLDEAREKFRVAGDHGRSGRLRVTPTEGGFLVVSAGGSDPQAGYAVGGGGADEVYRFVESDSALGATDRGTLYPDYLACRTESSTAALFDLGRFGGLIDWLFPTAVDPRDDRLARAMLDGAAVYRGDASVPCSRWHFLPDNQDGLSGRLENRESQDGATVVLSQEYWYDPTVRTLLLTAVTRQVLRDGQVEEEYGSGGMESIQVEDEGGPAINGVWFLRRGDCERADADDVSEGGGSE